MIRLAPEVGDALDAGRAVVALETTLVAHGFPAGEGLGVALDAERRVREAGAVPATVGVLDGRVQVGLTAEELERFAAAGESARKAGPRDLAVCIAEGVLGATTVARAPWFLDLFNRIPYLQRFPARLVGLGARPEHIHTPEAKPAWMSRRHI